MRYKIAWILVLLILLSGVTVSAQVLKTDNTITQDFSGYQSVDQAIPGELFDSYIIQPEFTQYNSTTSLKIPSTANKRNVLLMKPISLQTGTLAVDAVIAADDAPKVNWGKAPQVLLQYTDQNGTKQEVTLIEFAYSVIRVKVNQTEKAVKANFKQNQRYRMRFQAVKECVEGKYLLHVTYSVDGEVYTAEYTTCKTGEFQLGFSSNAASSLYLDWISREVTENLTQDYFLNFEDCQSVGECYPGTVLASHTNAPPTLESLSGGQYLAVSSASGADNILLLNQGHFQGGSLQVNFPIRADQATAAWGTASKVIIRYANQAGTVKNDGLIAFTGNAVKVNTDSGTVTVGNFQEKDYQVGIDIRKKIIDGSYRFVIQYSVDGQQYTKTYQTTETGTAGVGLQSIYGNSLYLKTLYQSERLPYRQPEQEEIKRAFTENCGNTAHPRVVMNQDRLEEIRSLIQQDASVQKWYAAVKTKADKALTAPVSTYELRDGERLLYVSRDVYANTVYPALVYLIEGETKYRDRIWKELEAVSKFQDWHPEHFLDTAEMTYAFALCYDWLYDSWTEKQRDSIREAIRKLGLDPALSAYDGTATYDKTVSGAYHNRIGWKKDPSNWGLVCNGAVAIGALAIMGESDSDYCAKLISEAIRGIEKPMTLYADDGAWSEGLGYWEYATRYFGYMMSTMQNTLGNTYGYFNAKGIEETINYFVAHTGTTGVFNYGDCSESMISAPVLLYLANQLERPDIAEARLNQMKQFSVSSSIDDILFYQPNATAELESHRNMKFDSVQVVTSANSRANNMANYFAAKGGKAGITHGDLDAGSFVIDSMGERWASDLGGDSYTLSGYFDWGTRYQYYRKKAEGHSTLVINPNEKADQKLGTTANIERFSSGEHGMCAVINMSEPYSDHANSVRRAVTMAEDYSKFIVQDEVKNKQPSDVYWFMQTNKSVVLAADGKSAVLSSAANKNKHMLLLLQSDCDTAKFEVTSATPLSTSPNPTGQAANKGYYRITVKSAGVTNLNMRVIMIPYMGTESPKFDSVLTDFDTAVQAYEQAVDSEQLAMLDSILVDGQPLEGFEAQQYSYQTGTDIYRYSNIEGVSDQYDVSVQYGKVTEITVSDPEGILKDGKYYIYFSNSTPYDKVQITTQKKRGNLTEQLRIRVDDTAEVYIARYDQSGKLIQVAKKNQADWTLEPEDSVKVFLWESGIMQPLKDSVYYSKDGIQQGEAWF